jgi:hypothetical protein
MAKSPPLWSTCKILDILQLFRMIWRFISLHTQKHHKIARLTLGTIFLKS